MSAFFCFFVFLPYFIRENNPKRCNKKETKTAQKRQLLPQIAPKPIPIQCLQASERKRPGYRELLHGKKQWKMGFVRTKSSSFGIKIGRRKGLFLPKIITKQLHRTKHDKTGSNKQILPYTCWKTKLQGLRKALLLIFRGNSSKCLQSFFFYGMISVDSYTHFEVRINIRIPWNVTFV